jgi:pantetheine hydrolase
MKRHQALLVLLFIAFLFPTPSLGSGATYRAGAFQHSPIGSAFQPASETIKTNLDLYQEAVQNSTKENVQILVFPEGGLGWVFAEINNTRDGALAFCEELPSTSSVFCDVLPDSLQLKTLSCLAKESGIVLVANLCTIQYCNTTDPDCPADGRYQWNTDVVFSSDGSLITKYYKSHLWGGAGIFNQPTVADPISFVAPFGVEFGVFICYDIDFSTPAESLVAQGITNFVFSSAWFNIPPVLTAVQIQQAWSRYYSTNLVAANSGAFEGDAGGGIYSSGVPINVLFDPTTYNIHQVLIGDVPITPITVPKPFQGTTERVLKQLSSSEPCVMTSFPQQLGNCVYLHPSEDPTSGTLTVSQGDFTCSLLYSLEPSKAENEVYALFTSRGNFSFEYTIDGLLLETCAFVHCLNPPNCSTSWWSPHSTSFSSFTQLTLQGGPFSSETRVFPVAGLHSSELVSPSLLSFSDNGLSFDSSSSSPLGPLFNFVLYGVGPGPVTPSIF